jgi:osmotically-inducible protein OsmY
MSRDDQLQKAVLDELSWEPSITAAHIGVAAADGTVTLTGHVESYGQKHAAEMAAGRVNGVKAIAEEIEVRLPFIVKRDDGDIAAAVVNRLAWDTGTPHEAVMVKVEGGWVTLTGEVERHYKKDVAEREIRNLLGVIGVSNQIAVKAHLDTAHLQDDIQRALHRTSYFQPDQVHVSAHSGHVKLTGTVRSWQERRTAESTAWAAPGATAVENNLVIA